MNRKVVPGTDLKAPAYGYIYRMKLQFRTNDQGDWFMWDVTDENDEPTHAHRSGQSTGWHARSRWTLRVAS
jgi:hypothetical protein